MRKKNLIMAGCMLALSVAMMTGCGQGSSGAGAGTAKESSTSDSSQKGGSTDQKGEQPKDDGSKMVQVSKVDGDTITATVGEDMRGGKGPGNGCAPNNGNNGSDDKQAPPDGDSSSDNKQAPPDLPDGDSSSEKSSGNAADGKDGGNRKGGMPFTATDETMTFKITSDTKITTGGRDNQTEASSGDIKENSVLRVTVNDSNEAQSIEIMGGGNNGAEKS